MGRDIRIISLWSGRRAESRGGVDTFIRAASGPAGSSRGAESGEAEPREL